MSSVLERDKSSGNEKVMERTSDQRECRKVTQSAVLNRIVGDEIPQYFLNKLLSNTKLDIVHLSFGHKMRLSMRTI